MEHGDGSVVTRCVAFDASSISGEELLNRSGVAWSSQTFGGFGDAVCALDGEPARYVDCPGKDSYWAVFVARGGGSWQLANVGISTLALHDGDAEGFRYVPASGVPAAPVSPAACARAAATPAPRRSVAAGASAPPAAPTPSTAATPATTPAGATAAVTDPPAPAAPLAAGTGSTAPAAAAGSGAGTVRRRRPGPDRGVPLAGGGLAGLAILRLVAGRRKGL